MKFLSTALTALLILLDSQEEVGSQSLLVGSHDPKTSNAVWKQNRSKGFEVAHASSNRSRQLLANSTSRWVEVGNFPQLEDSAFGGYYVSMSGDGTFLASMPASILEGDFDPHVLQDLFDSSRNKILMEHGKK